MSDYADYAPKKYANKAAVFAAVANYNDTRNKSVRQARNDKTRVHLICAHQLNALAVAAKANKNAPRNTQPPTCTYDHRFKLTKLTKPPKKKATLKKNSDSHSGGDSGGETDHVDGSSHYASNQMSTWVVTRLTNHSCGQSGQKYPLKPQMRLKQYATVVLKKTAVDHFRAHNALSFDTVARLYPSQDVTKNDAARLKKQASDFVYGTKETQFSTTVSRLEGYASYDADSTVIFYAAPQLDVG